MIVYGDPHFKISLAELFRALRQCIFATQGEDLDELRRLLVQAGQFEQAIADLPVIADASETAQKLTDLAAVAFVAAYARCEPRLPAPQLTSSAALNQLRDAVSSRADFPDAAVTVKIPEGFEFYALYPEQYCLSALRWSEENVGSGPDRTVLVIGIRSIGTALSALVAATLAAAGWRSFRITVRPTGAPFARCVELSLSIPGSARYALVVDEGPGLSGSSMAAVAETFVCAGFKHQHMSFLPGHDREPGSAASAQVRWWWAHTPRHVTCLEELRWNGLKLTESLQEKSCDLLDSKASLTKIEDLSGGFWRRKIYRTQAAWPWTAIPFERLKFLCSTADGRSILWKFAGFGASKPGLSAGREELTGSAGQDWTSQPLDWFRGFVALPWVDGKNLSVADGRNRAVLRHIGSYIAAASGLPLSHAEQMASLDRLTEMLYWNAKEALGDALAGWTLRAAEEARKLRHCPAYGDGRLAPCEWVRLRSGQILKLDGMGHDVDHTIVGRQPMYWDVAGAMVEWKLTQASCAPLLAAVRASGIAICPKVLSFYRMAYAAFRMGQALLCANACAQDPSERARLQRAVAAYRADLLEQLLIAP